MQNFALIIFILNADTAVLDFILGHFIACAVNATCALMMLLIHQRVSYDLACKMRSDQAHKLPTP